MLTLKTALLLNGISSGATGIGLVTFARPVSSLFGIYETTPFIYAGLFLIIFGLYVVRTALNMTPGFTALRLIALLDLLWIIASIGLVMLDGSQISVIGNVLIIAVAAWVGLMTALQSRAGKQLSLANRV